MNESGLVSISMPGRPGMPVPTLSTRMLPQPAHGLIEVSSPRSRSPDPAGSSPYSGSEGAGRPPRPGVRLPSPPYPRRFAAHAPKQLVPKRGADPGACAERSLRRSPRRMATRSQRVRNEPYLRARVELVATLRDAIGEAAGLMSSPQRRPSRRKQEQSAGAHRARPAGRPVPAVRGLPARAEDDA
jgi:hypothetical protein